ncbi:hypothetical protein EST38_g12450 [Candolleomyces aberdarensis]|uniref:Uncharacterized protein n=1 Tax=Candolleomyces aberdarensis TaxID=2316362 RepID=A0A4Q2D4E2_9AGAR|nr:hypothetical protein EST38_g12450 [Candolleomyces aberdarensis]
MCVAAYGCRVIRILLEDANFIGYRAASQLTDTQSEVENLGEANRGKKLKPRG